MTEGSDGGVRGGGDGAGEAGTGLGAVLGEIPAASAGMTDLFCAGVAERFCAGVVGRRAGSGGLGLFWAVLYLVGVGWHGQVC